MDKIYKFSNGLRLALCPMEHTRSMAIGVFVGAGAANESVERSGLSHFTEHMLFKGTEKRKPFDIASEMESVGAQINAFTARHMTCYYTISTDEHTELCMEMLSDIFFNSTFLPEEIEREKKVVLEEISRDEDDPEDVCNEGLASVFYGDSSMGRPILGSPENVKSFTRDDIVSYMNEYYVPSNTVISIAGSFKIEDAINLASRYFENNFKSSIVSETPKKSLTHSASFVKIKPTEQANIAFAFPSYPFGHAMTEVVSLISNVFGGGMSSRLFQNVRERYGLAYDIYSVASANLHNGSFSIFIGTNPKNTEKASVAIRKEIEDLKLNGVTTQEFHKGVEQLKTNVVLGSESSLSLMRANGRYMIMTGEMFDVNKRLKIINSITKENIDTAIRYIFNFDNVASSYVGPKTDADVFEIIKGGNYE